MVARRDIALGLDALLELAFVIQRQAVRLDRFDLLLEQQIDKQPGRFQPLVEVDRRDQRLECIGQQRVALAGAVDLLALAQANVGAQAQIAREPGQRCGSNQRRAQASQLALAATGKAIDTAASQPGSSGSRRPETPAARRRSGRRPGRGARGETSDAPARSAAAADRRTRRPRRVCNVSSEGISVSYEFRVQSYELAMLRLITLNSEL